MTTGASVSARVVACVAAGFALAFALSLGVVPAAGRALQWPLLAAAHSAAVLAALWALRRWALAPRADLLAQIEAVSGGRFEPRVQGPVAEWVPLACALNIMVARVGLLLAERDQRLGALRAEVSLDDLTGLASRLPFMEQLAQALGLAAGSAASADGGVVLLRLNDLAGLNQRAGRERADELLKAVATLLRTRSARLRSEHALAARLNGADLALLIPAVSADVLETWAGELAAALPALRQLSLSDRQPVAWVAATTWRAGESVGDVMARADRTLQSCEAGSDAWRMTTAAQAEVIYGVAQWRTLIDEALATGRVTLSLQRVNAADGRLHHHEASLRMAVPGGAVLTGADVLPAALRTARTADVELRGVELALARIAAGAAPLIFSLSAQSVLRPSFLSRLTTVLSDAAQGAAGLWLQVDASGEHELASLITPLAAAVHGHGVRLGLHRFGLHGSQLAQFGGLGLSFLQLDAAQFNVGGAGGA